VFILVTSLPDMLLPTVLSRCPQLRFRPLSAVDIASALMARGHSETEARAVAATADGSLGQALQASAGELVESRDIAQRILEQSAAQPDPARRIDTAKALVAKATAGASERDQLATHLRAMSVLLRDVELLAGGDARAGERRCPPRARTTRDRLSRRAWHAGVRGG
jgi:DNA polymerase-3 subunit delta'